MTLLSIVIPVLNEEENVPHILPVLDEALAPLLAEGWRLEIIFTDNHSSDRTFPMLREMAVVDSRVRAIRFSKNVGYQKSIRAGYLAAKGDCVAQLDADLQDPPALLVEMARLWRDGAAVVYGVRKTRREGWAITLMRRAFYRLIDALSEDHLPPDAGDFRIVDRRIVELLRRSPTAHPYLRGEIAAMGFRQDAVVYDRGARLRGNSKFPLRKMISLAIDGIVSQSVVPLRVATYAGLTISLLTVVGACAYLLARIVLDVAWPPGFATTTILLLLGLGLNALFLGIIGEYLGRVYVQTTKPAEAPIEIEIGGDAVTPPPPPAA